MGCSDSYWSFSPSIVNLLTSLAISIICLACMSCMFTSRLVCGPSRCASATARCSNSTVSYKRRSALLKNGLSLAFSSCSTTRRTWLILSLKSGILKAGLPRSRFESTMPLIRELSSSIFESHASFSSCNLCSNLFICWMRLSIILVSCHALLFFSASFFCYI